MKNTVLILLLIFPIGIYGQTKDSIKSKKLDVGITFSPDYCYRILKADEVSRQLATVYDTTEIAKYGYTTGINGVYNLSDKLSFSIGALFSDKGERFKEKAIPTFTKYVNHYYYLDLPVRVNYYFINKNIKLFATVGGSANLFLKHSINTMTELSTNAITYSSTTALSKFSFGVLTGIGVDCPLSKSWVFKIEILYRQSVTPMVNTPIKRYLYSIGPNFGLYYHF